MATEIRPVPDGVADDASDVVATPEGDNEILSDEPLEPASDAAVSGLQVPRGNEPADKYKNDRT